jgi:uncharacterized protein
MGSHCVKPRGPGLWIAGSRFARPGMMALAAAFCLFASLALAYDFPALSGRIVDQAGVINAATKSELETKLKTLEDKSGIQLVVATVKSLQGGDIETYANELFRSWKLGEAKKNNGVLLLVAPTERKVRIEVGYGLEGTLTDALSSVIISSAVIPRFKTGDFSGGIERGVDGIISVLSGDSAEWQPKLVSRFRASDNLGLVLVGAWCVLVVFFIFFLGFRNAHTKHYVIRKGHRVLLPAGSSSGSSGWSGGWSSGGSSGGSSDSGFSGGGGSSGGGGASGSW